MTDQSEPTDSPTQWVAEHTRRYVDTDGADGHMWRPPGWIGAGDWPQGVPTLLLTTIGRHSGKPRRTALIYGRDGERYLVVGSVGGADQHPAWYFNLLENPDVELQVGAERFAGRAYSATPEEKPRLWKLMTAIWPSFDRYHARTTRDIPLIVVERA